MSSITVEFAFELGDRVYFKNATHSDTKVPSPFTVVERIGQECPGGIQRLYRLAEAQDRGLINEIALTRELPPYEPMRESDVEAVKKEVAWEVGKFRKRRKEKE